MISSGIPNFNSIKVRLEHPKDVELKEIDIFQFHKGAIRTVRGYINSFIVSDFNSIKVRLEQNYQENKVGATNISIP